MSSFFIFSHNLDLLSVGVVVAAMTMLGFVTLFTNPKSLSNRLFFGLTIAAGTWGVVNYFAYRSTDPDTALLMLRLVMFFAVWAAFFSYTFAHVFPLRRFSFSRPFKFFLLPLTILTSALSLTPAVFKSITELTSAGTVSETETGFGIIVFGITAVILNFGCLIELVKRTLHTNGDDRKMLLLILMGFSIMLLLIMLLNYLLPAFRQDIRFIPFGAFFMFPFIALTAYAIFKHSLFNIKVAASGLLIFVLSLVTFLEVVFASELYLLVYRSSVFILVLFFGVLLVRNITQEVKQRERIEELATNLKKANDRLQELDRLKSEFVSIASHQLRSPLTAIKGYASLILEGSFGKTTEAVTEAVQKIFDSSSLMAVSVQDFLDVSRIEQGKMKYNFEDFDLAKLVQTVVEELTPIAQKKGLELTLRIDDTEKFMVHADLGKIKQVLNNLIDNSIKYTPKGSVNVVMCKIDGKIDVEIRDTGVGISKETLAKLFEKFVRSRNAHHVNVSGTGLGLFVVKEMVKAHNGRVWASSDGEGKGSIFHVELEEQKT